MTEWFCEYSSFIQRKITFQIQDLGTIKTLKDCEMKNKIS